MKFQKDSRNTHNTFVKDYKGKAVKIVRTSRVRSAGIIFLEGVTDTNRGIIALETNENAA